MRIYHHSPEKPLPRWAKAVFLRKCTKRVTPANQISSNGTTGKYEVDESKAKQSSEDRQRMIQNTTEWHALAKVIDKVFFALFLSLYVGITVILYVYIMSCKAGGSLCLLSVIVKG